MSDLPHSTTVPVIQQRTVLRVILAGSLAVGALCALTFIYEARITRDAVNYYAPKGYVRQVTGMLTLPAIKEKPAQNGPLRHESASGAPGDPTPRWGEMFFDQNSATDRQRDFYDLSGRLQRDIKMFNDSGDGFFRQMYDDSIWVDPTYHKFALPYPVRGKFHGMITLGDEPKPSIKGEGLMLAFDTVPQNRPPLLNSVSVLAFNQWAVGAKNRPHENGTIYDLCGMDGVPLIRFIGADNRVKLQLIDREQTRLYLNGDQINIPGSPAALAFLERKDDNASDSAAPLNDGDRLRIQFKKGDREIALRFGRYSGSLASRSWIEDGKQVTLVDPELAKSMPYVADLHAALNRYVEAHPDPKSIGQPNIRLTFDRDLHAGISDIFLPYIRRFDARRSPFRNISLEPGCICVMDALNGDVLAMPSYPAPADIEGFRRRLASRSIEDLSEAKVRRLALNQNLTLVPIGSTTKPLFALAIWDQYPNLRNLVVDESGSSRSTIFDYKLAKSFNTVPRGLVTPESFLRVSSNDYTVHLGMLMLAGPDVKLSRDGRSIVPGNRLNFHGLVMGDQIRGGLARPDLPAFAKLHDCFETGIEANFQGGVEEGWQAAPLGKVFEQMHAKGELLYRCFSDVLPQRTNLRLDRVTSVRGSFLSVLLGSGSNYWSNVMLAQAYSRIGTQRMVSARFATEPKDNTKITDFEKLPLDPAVLNMVQKSMMTTAEGAEGSTADRIAPAIRAQQAKFKQRGLKLIALCKTGTAGRVPAVRDASRNIILPARECAAFCLYLEVRDAKDHILAAVTSSTYLQDRGATRDGSPRNSAVAVDLTNDFLPKLISWLETKPGVGAVVAKR